MNKHFPLMAYRVSTCRKFERDREASNNQTNVKQKQTPKQRRGEARQRRDGGYTTDLLLLF